MSGQRIDDHKFWAGGKGKNAVMPDGVHTKEESSEDGVGALAKYEDTSEAIKAQQALNKKKVNGHPMKSGYRN